VLLTDGGEPESYQEDLEHEYKREWLKAMKEELKSLHENHTYDLIKLPKGKRALKNKWVFKLKTEEGCSHPRYKARLVVKGFNQKKGFDFEEIFSLVVKMSSIRVVLGMAASMNLKIEQLDVKTTFLHGDLEEEIYMEQPEGSKVKRKENLVCKLVTSRSRGYRDVTATYIRRSKIPSRIYAKHQYRQESECGSTMIIYIITEKYKYMVFTESDTISQEYYITIKYKSTLYEEIYITKDERCSRAAREASRANQEKSWEEELR